MTKISSKQTIYESYGQPSYEGEAYVILLLAISTAKSMKPELNTFAGFEKETEDKLVKMGAEVIEGKKKAEDYIKELEKAFNKAVDLKIKFDAYTSEQIKMRIERSVRDTSLQNKSNEKIKKNSTLKEEQEPIDNLTLDKTQTKLGKESKMQLNKKEEAAQIPVIANELWKYEGKWEYKQGYLSLNTDDKILAASQEKSDFASYTAKWLPRLKEFVNKLRQNQIFVDSYSVYHNKNGYISLQIVVKGDL